MHRCPAPPVSNPFLLLSHSRPRTTQFINHLEIKSILCQTYPLPLPPNRLSSLHQTLISRLVFFHLSTALCFLLDQMTVSGSLTSCCGPPQDFKGPTLHFPALSTMSLHKLACHSQFGRLLLSDFFLSQCVPA